MKSADGQKVELPSFQVKAQELLAVRITEVSWQNGCGILGCAELPGKHWEVGPNFMAIFQPSVGDYYVETADGYSFSVSSVVFDILTLLTPEAE